MLRSPLRLGKKSVSPSLVQPLFLSYQWSLSHQGEKEEVKLVEVVSKFSKYEGVIVARLVPVEPKDEENEVRVYERQVHDGFQLVQTYKSKKMEVFKFRILAERVERGEGDKQLWNVM
ncbi:uncharacterized protein A4U43_C07F13500 [Asparagus officinalis]|uniref:Uncharacterized protein n=1 Tax=Asparagus officinalis TaxID=4686 RepID=A0A5P1EBP1_ASPOF|nr:uncharacterized protein A4U43_C07F13500 [Asparagus officinalis]